MQLIVVYLILSESVRRAEGVEVVDGLQDGSAQDGRGRG